MHLYGVECEFKMSAPDETKLAFELQADVAANSSTSRTPAPRNRVNANHLLNFQPGVRDVRRTDTASSSHRYRSSTGRSNRPAYDRRKFLQANFKFLISDAADVAKYEADADLMLDWEEDIVGVEMITTTPVICPITLDSPLCPCITPCGHIFSYEALMAHLITQGGGPELRASSACPICLTKIAGRELRPVTVREVGAVHVGDTVTFQLLRRARESIIPTKVEVLVESVEKGNERVACNPFAKFTVVADPMPLWISYAAILGQKSAQLIAEGGTDAAFEFPPVLASIEMLASSAKSWAARRQLVILEQLEFQDSSSPPEEVGLAAMAVVKRAAERSAYCEERKHQKAAADQALNAEFPALSLGSNTTSSSSSHHQEQQQIDEQLRRPLQYSLPFTAALPPSSSSLSSSLMEPSYYFYQSADGQPLFLGPLNMKMLLEGSGGSSYAALPAQVTAPVLELEEVEMNEQNRKRLKSVMHWPLGGTLRLCEIDLKEVLPASALSSFQAELEQRVKKRAQHAKQEARKVQRESARAAAVAAAAEVKGPSAAELKAMPSLPGAVPSQSSYHYNGDSNAVNTDEEIAAALAAAAAAAGNGEIEDPAMSGGGGDGPSFARIAKMGFAATGPALGESSTTSTGTSPASSAAFPGPWGQSPVSSGSTGGGSAWGAWASKTRDADQPSATDAGSNAAPPAGEFPPGKRKGKKMLILSTSSHRF